MFPELNSRWYNEAPDGDNVINNNNNDDNVNHDSAVKMIIKYHDNNNDNAFYDTGDPKIKILQIMLFREPLISKKKQFLAFSHVQLFSYWHCQVTIPIAYNASVMMLWHSCQSIMSGYYVISL